MDIKTEAIGRGAIKIVNSVVNIAVLTIILLSVAFAGYALWDARQIYQAADKSNYAVYKPTVEDEGKSFQELQALNGEVFAWLSVYGTNIDYPVTQGQTNMKYVNTDAEGRYSLSGSIFLDCNNSGGFSDFNNILYGHHMTKKAMFGEIGEFAEKKMFDTHRYGNLYFDGKDHGIEFFAFIHTDAYDSMVFTPNVEQDDRPAYLDNILSKAIHKRDIGVTTEDRIILLSTCSSSSTNGRDLLVGRITDEVYADLTTNAEINDGKMDSQFCFVKKVYLWPILLAILIMLRLVYILVIYHRQKQNEKIAETG